jgi:lipid A disaccharide synthetase
LTKVPRLTRNSSSRQRNTLTNYGVQQIQYHGKRHTPPYLFLADCVINTSGYVSENAAAYANPMARTYRHSGREPANAPNGGRSACDHSGR